MTKARVLFLFLALTNCFVGCKFDAGNSSKNEIRLPDKSPPTDKTSKPLATPFGISNFGNTCFSATAIQCFLAAARTDVMHNTFKEGSLLSLLKGAVVSNGDSAKLKQFIETSQSKLGCPLGVQYESLWFLNDFLRYIGREDPSVHSKFILSNRLTVKICNNHSEQDMSKYDEKNNYIVIKQKSDNLQDALVSELRINSQCGINNCTEQCQVITSFSWPKNLIVVNGNINSSLKPSLNITIDKIFTEDKKEKNYNLIAIAIYDGHITSGHYYAYVKHNKSWYLANDASVSPVPLETIETLKKFSYLIYQLD